MRISQPAVASRERAATSRMSSSSSMIRMRRMSVTYSLMRRKLLEVTGKFLPRRQGRGGEIGEPGAHALDHGKDELFDLLGLDLGLGEELGGAEAKLGHFDVGDLAAGVDDQGKSAEGRLLAEPLDEREAVAVGEGEVEDEEVGTAVDAVPDGLLAGGGVVDVDGGVLEAGGEDAGEVFVIFDEKDVGRAVALVQDAAEFGEEEVFVEGLLYPALGVAGELGAEGGGEDAEDHYGDVGRGGLVAEPLEGLPTA